MRVRRVQQDAAMNILDVLQQYGGGAEINTYDRPWVHPLWTDASGGSKGGGGWFQADSWHQYKHTRGQRKACIAWLEMYAVYMALLAKGEEWRGCVVPLLIDNLTCAHVLRRGRSRSKNLNDLLRKIMVVAMECDIVIHAYWIPTECNKLADPLSRYDQEEFMRNRTSWRQFSRDTLAYARTLMPRWLTAR